MVQFFSHANSCNGFSLYQRAQDYPLCALCQTQAAASRIWLYNLKCVSGLGLSYFQAFLHQRVWHLFLGALALNSRSPTFM